ncbi:MULTISPECIES: PhoP regulatory network protein YrbL [Escherichia]|uniref:PhoP regulatory network protein YrbL n=2 Tax=Escherichia fergusonii TaxID=564 RepID=B7LR74_ESCF3|nr:MULTISPECIES: PhoP regulatory network protein YrbL [Escherichia]MCU8646021.1 PhoP regulatory network protein YrbL [Escherichia coli]EFF0767145.1 PhoP regulatory network protein YrbL [Escherichia fergusonii]EFL4481428.1 PhoP regulatory network protein YrbL [Escherichia fergusonii]EFL4493662.1 PhoP regulatory network protein YrbL [Escherichia fergusonii]EFL4510592.1 PhoP regulatory network protein YrbL [Escherichia fergusonii]
MIYLSKQNPLGTGRHRKCYAHPEDAQRCIKIVYHTGSGGDKEIRRELKYYAHLSRYLQDWSGIPRFHGTVETDCGTGYIYDVIADFDGKPSVTLTEFAAQCHYEEDVVVLRQLLKKLKKYLHDNYIVTMTLKPQNILCHRISESEVVPVVCDNIGEGTLIPLATWSKWFCRRKQERLWQRFIKQPVLAVALKSDKPSKERNKLSLSSREA